MTTSEKNGTYSAPWYQVVLRRITFVLFGITALGVFLDAISNAVAIVTPKVTYYGTGIILIIWTVIEVVLRYRPLLWSSKGNNKIVLKKLGIKPQLAVVGAITLLWIPRIISINTKVEREQRAQNDHPYITSNEISQIGAESSRQIAGLLEQVPQGAELNLTAENIATYKIGLTDPGVAQIRRFLNTYKFRPDELNDLEQTAALRLNELPSEHFKGRFVVVVVNRFLLGGRIITIMFDNPPYAIVDVWVREDNVRDWQEKKLSDEDRKKLAQYLGGFLKHPDYSL